ncbi:MAG TPA: aldo/keto reductase [Chthoniobacterales bacterium]|jgi:diketogulonate reductase-like aldo/keto reductase
MGEQRSNLTRRQVARVLGGATASTLLALPMSAAKASAEMLLREIPSTGEKLPAIGLGTSGTFDVGDSSSDRGPLREVLHQFVRLGGKVVDTSPMYGKAEGVIGDLTGELRVRDQLFLATKVWTSGQQEGVASMERSLVRLRTRRLDLMQVHNLVDLKTQLATARAWKKEGRLRYIGVTHYVESALPELERVLQSEKLDFIQINYSIAEREAEKRVLPLARDRGVAVLINRPFARGDLFSRLRSTPLPAWAQDFDCLSWAQFLLKWILANRSVTCVIPATSDPRHLEDNMGGGMGRLPDEKMRRRMTDLVVTLSS